MRTEEINIRDPYILKHNNVFYLYGTRSCTCWSEAEGFDCYKSNDLIEWEGPIEIFRRPLNFWADRRFWAPECYAHQGKFYLVTTFGAENKKSGIQILVSEKPEGPFAPLTDRAVTPLDWTCIDGTLYWEGDTPYLVFSHSFEDEPMGCICRMTLSKDLTRGVEPPVNMFSAADAPWAVPVPFAEEEFGISGPVYFTDGPCLHQTDDGRLVMFWSSWGGKGYAVGTAYSEDGSIGGTWKHMPGTIFPGDGGHGMLFEDKEGNNIYTLHYPNERYKEHPVFFELIRQEGLQFGLRERKK